MINDFFLTLANLAGKNYNDYAVLILILATACCLINYDLYRLAGIRGSLRKLNGELGRMEGYGIENVKKLDALFGSRSHIAVRSTWEACYGEFRNIRNRERTLDLRGHFSLFSVITIPARRKRAETVPGILVMAGILAAFFGIMAYLLKADAASMTDTKDVMNGLMNNIAASFGIAFAAILLSILFQLVDRYLYHSAVSELNLFLNLAVRKMPVAKETDSLEAMIAEQRRQNETLQSLGAGISAQLGTFIAGDLVPSIHKSFDEAIQKQIAPTIKEMSGMLQRMSEEVRETQTKGVQAMVDSFAEKLVAATGLQLEQLGESISVILEYQGRAEENTFKLIRELLKNVELQKNVNAETGKVLETIRLYQQQSAEMNTALAENMQSMKLFNDALREAMASDSQSMEDLNSRYQALQEERSKYFEKMDEQIGRLLEELSLQLDAAFSRFNDIMSLAYERLDTNMNTTVEGLSTNLKSLADSMDDQVRDISIYAKGLSEEVSELSDRLGNAVNEFSGQMNAGVVKTMDAFDEGLSEICGRFGRVISDMKDAVEDLPALIEAMDRHKAGVREMTK